MRAFYCRALVSWVIAMGVLAGGSSVATQTPHFVRITPAEVRWHDIPGGQGAQEATLLGDPDKPGMYVIRVKFPPHLMDSHIGIRMIDTSRCSRALGTRVPGTPSTSPEQFHWGRAA